MTDLDDLLAEVAIRTDRSHHWTGEHQLTISDAELAKELAVAVRALRDRPCPHVQTGDEGTSHCALAESANTAWAARVKRAESETRLWRNRFEAAETLIRDHDCDDCNDSLSDLLAVPDRPGGTDNPTSDEPRRCMAFDGFRCVEREGHKVGHVFVPAWCDEPQQGCYPAPTGGDDGR